MFFAPELFSKEKQESVSKYGEKTDVWALGISFYQILCGRLPYEDAKDIMHLKTLVEERDINFQIVPENARETIAKMLVRDPNKRASIEELLCDSWVTNDGIEKIEVDQVEANHLGNINRALAFLSKSYGQSFKIKKVSCLEHKKSNQCTRQASQ